MERMDGMGKGRGKGYTTATYGKFTILVVLGFVYLRPSSMGRVGVLLVVIMILRG